MFSTFFEEAHETDAGIAFESDLIEVNIGKSVWDLLVIVGPIVELKTEVEIPGVVLDHEGEWKTEIRGYQVLSPWNLKSGRYFPCSNTVYLLLVPLECRL